MPRTDNRKRPPLPNEPPAPNRITELKVSAHLMTLERGLFCIVQTRSRRPNDASGLPGVRVSVPPGGEHAVTVSGFRPDGWLGGPEDAALVRVTEPAPVLVTIYQAPGQEPDTAPKLQVLRLSPEPAAASASPLPSSPAVPAEMPAGRDVVAHVQGEGDVAARFGEWIGTRGSGAWIEGFGIAPSALIAPSEIEYQAVLGRNWSSPWAEGGTFCGSRGMSLPLLGLRVRLRGAAAERYECSYEATFTDGSRSGPHLDGEACEATTLAPLEALQIVVTPRPGRA